MKVITLLGMASIALTLHSCNPKPGDRSDYEGYIPKDTANKMIGSYLASISSDADLQNPDVHSLIVDADLLRNYLKNPEIKRVKVMLAHTLEYINTGHGGQNAGYKSGALTIVFAGFGKDGNYIFAPGNMVPNHAVPCPRNCPDAGSAAQNLLQ